MILSGFHDSLGGRLKPWYTRPGISGTGLFLLSSRTSCVSWIRCVLVISSGTKAAFFFLVFGGSLHTCEKG
jgi:hypothetical protein